MSTEVNIFQIEIPKRSTHCSKGNELLVPGSEYYSTLTLDKEKGYARQDFCLSCWENSEKNGVQTAWKAKVVTKNEQGDHSSKTRDEKAIHLLKGATASFNEEEWAEVFVLALYLARRRILYLRQELTQEDGSTLCIYEVAATEEMIPVKRKSLMRVNIDEVQSKIAQKLKK
jgi:hypothetical protein